MLSPFPIATQWIESSVLLLALSGGCGGSNDSSPTANSIDSIDSNPKVQIL